MKKKAVILSLLLVMLMSTTIFASSGYMFQSMTIPNSYSSSTDVGYNSTTTARVDVNTISDTGGCTKVKVFIINTGTGNATPTHILQVQNTKFYSVNQGNIKAIFQRNSTSSGIMNVGYSFVYNY